MTLLTKTEAKKEIDRSQSITRVPASAPIELQKLLKDNKQCVLLVLRQ